MLAKAAPQDNLQGQHSLARDTKFTRGNVQRGIYLVNYSFRNIRDKRVEARVLYSNTLFLDSLVNVHLEQAKCIGKVFMLIQ